MRGDEDSDPFRMAELMDSDGVGSRADSQAERPLGEEEVPDGVGCTEIWEHMSEVREDDDDAEGECQEDDDTDYGETAESVRASDVDLVVGDEDLQIEDAELEVVEMDEVEIDDSLAPNEFSYECGEMVYEGSMEIEFGTEPEHLLDALRLLDLLTRQ